MSNSTVSEWPLVSLGDLARVKRGASPRPIQDPKWFSAEGHGWVRIADVTASDRVLLQTTQYLSDAGKASSVEIVPGDLIMSICGTIGRPLFSGIYACIHDGFVAFKDIDKARIDPDYLYFFLQAHSRHFEAQSQPGTQRNLNSALVGKTEMPLPPVNEQRRIAEVLRSVDEAIGANEAVATQARRAYQAAMTELVGSGNDHWETIRLGQIATFVNGRGFKPHEWGDEGLPIIRIQNLNGGTDFNYYSGDFNPKILVHPGDLLFAWSGSRGTSFGPHIWRGPQGVLNYHTWNVLPNAAEDRDFLYFALRYLTKKIEDEAHGASALVHMQKAYVVDYEISLPPPNERNAIAGTLIDLQEAAAHADRVHREAQAMKANIMSDLLSGQVRVRA